MAFLAAGSTRCAVAMGILGSSVAVTASLGRYPLLAGQAWRYAVAGALLTAFVRWRGLRRARPSRVRRGDAGRLLALAALGMVAFNVCLVEACRRVPPSLVGSVVGASPVVTALVAPALRRRRPAPGSLLAAAVVTAGVVLVEGGGQAETAGVLLAVGAMLGEVSFSLVALPLLGRWGPLRTSAGACWVATALLLVLAAVTGEPLAAVPDPGQAVALAYLAVVMTAVAFVLWYAGLQRLGPERAGLFAGVVPVAAAMTSVVTGHEHASLRVAAGSAVVAAGLLAGVGAAGGGGSRSARCRRPSRCRRARGGADTGVTR